MRRKFGQIQEDQKDQDHDQHTAQAKTPPKAPHREEDSLWRMRINYQISVKYPIGDNRDFLKYELVLLPPASEGWGRYCFHRCLSVHTRGEVSHLHPIILGFFTIRQSDAFLSDYMTDLKLHGTK